MVSASYPGTDKDLFEHHSTEHRDVLNLCFKETLWFLASIN